MLAKFQWSLHWGQPPTPHSVIMKSKTKKVRVKKHKCDQCGKAFTHSQYLTSHIETVHLGLQKNKCDTCNRCFNLPHHLRDHIDTVRERPTESSISFCWQFVDILISFQVHLRLKKYKCEKCHKCFSHPHNRKVHFETVHLGLKR